MKLNKIFIACAICSAVPLTVLGGYGLAKALESTLKNPSAPGIHTIDQDNTSSLNGGITEYTSDNAPNRIFTLAAGGVAQAVTSNPIAKDAVLKPNAIHYRTDSVIPGTNTTVIEFTSDNVPNTLFIVTAGGFTVAITQTPIAPKP